MTRQPLAGPDFDSDEQPLDPAVLRVQLRLRRLMLIAGLTLGLGFFAVFGAILYRIMNSDSTGALPAASGAVEIDRAALGVSADARLVSTALDGSRLALTFEEVGRLTVVAVDMHTGAVLERMVVNR